MEEINLIALLGWIKWDLLLNQELRAIQQLLEQDNQFKLLDF